VVAPQQEHAPRQRHLVGQQQRERLHPPRAAVHKVAVEHVDTLGAGVADGLEPAGWGGRGAVGARAASPLCGFSFSVVRNECEPDRVGGGHSGTHRRRTSWNWPWVSPTTETGQLPSSDGLIWCGDLGRAWGNNACCVL